MASLTHTIPVTDRVHLCDLTSYTRDKYKFPVHKDVYGGVVLAFVNFSDKKVESEAKITEFEGKKFGRDNLIGLNIEQIAKLFHDILISFDSVKIERDDLDESEHGMYTARYIALLNLDGGDLIPVQPCLIIAGNRLR